MPEESDLAFTIGSSAFKNGETIPSKFTGDGVDISPAIAWSDPPSGTKSFALICDDPDAPMGTWTHWVIYDMPGEQRMLGEAVPLRETLERGTKQGLNTWRRIGYGGPSPPPGRPHRYFFKIYALDSTLNLPAGVSKEVLIGAMQGKIIGEAEFHGTYGRKR